MTGWVVTRLQEELRERVASAYDKKRAIAAMKADRERIKQEAKESGFFASMERGIEGWSLVVRNADGDWLTSYGWSIDQQH